jgi:hypothetical protein
MAESRLRAVLSNGRLVFAVTAVACFLGSLGPLASYDVWWHLKAGRMIAESGQVPHVDVFSFTATGRPWTDHSWLAGMALAGIWEAAGTTGLVLYHALMTTASLMIAWVLARRRGVSAGLAGVLTLAACLQLRPLEAARPFLFSFILFIVFACLLQTAFASSVPEGGGARARYWLWGPGGRLALLPPLTLLWANLHAGFLVGFILLGAYGVGEMVRLAAARGGRSYLALLVMEPDGGRLRAMFGMGVASLLASLVTPYGPGVLTYTFRLLGTVKLLGQIQEWRPAPNSRDYAVFWGLLVIGTVVLARSIYATVRGGKLRAEAGQLAVDVILCAGFGIMAARQVRHLPWVMLLTPSVLGYRFSAPSRLVETAGRRLAHAGAALALAVVVAASPFAQAHPRLFGVNEDFVPMKACDFMADHGFIYRPFNSYEWGGYLILRFWPQMQVFIDGRTDLYGDEIIGQYIRVDRAGEGWRDVLSSYDVQMLLLNYRRSSATHFFEDRRWRCVYWDDAALIALRDDVLAAAGPGLTEYRLSNPAVFERSLTDAPAADILAELDGVLARDPKCWTALSFRARCLVRLAEAQPARRNELLKQAREAARQAMDLEDERPAPWKAAADVARALGDKELADRADRNAQKYAKRKT